jgi:hypothetical protein
MMKFSKYIFLALGISALVSCSEDFLEKEPLAVLSSSTLASDSAVLNMAVNRLYGSINWREYGLGRQHFGTKEACADDFISGSTADFSNIFGNYTYMASNGWIQQYWDRTYQNIHYCNLVIDNVPKTNAKKMGVLYEAQARYFRGYYNFDLTNVFGDAVLREHDPSAVEYNIPKSTHAEIIASVITDLKFAIANLPKKGATGWETGRVTKGTAQGLLAKVYLYEQDYVNAKAWADSVVQGGEYSLFPSYRNLFSPDNTTCQENMMPGQYFWNASIADGRKWNPYVQWQGLPAIGGNAGLVPSQNLVNAYESGDPRKKATIFEKNVNDTVQGFGKVSFPAYTNYANNKVIWPKTYWNNNTFSWTACNPMFLRYAEIVLINAEASNELGKTADALKYLEQVRFRARGNKTFEASIAAGENGGLGVLPEVKTTDKAQLRLAIWHERRIELAFEFNRWFDLVRYNKVANADGSDGTGYTQTLLHDTYGKTNFNYEKHSHFPIPSTYITSSNGVLVQNPNW